MKQLKHLLMATAFAASSFSLVLTAAPNKAKLQNKLDNTVQDLQSLSNEITTLLEKTNKQLNSSTKLASRTTNNNTSRFLFRKEQEQPAVVEEKSDRNVFVKRGDYKLGIGGKAKVEHYFQKNIALLNSQLPDQAEYFKNTFDLIFDLGYGQKTFGHKAVEAFVNLRHKGVWGRGAVFADSDSTSPSDITLGKGTMTKFGGHRHTNGKPLAWIKDAWLKVSINALLNQKNPTNKHFIQLGWFPFELGRGIALGSSYGFNREGLGLYSYPEDKSAPGLLISGDIVADKLSYNLYYSKFEERDKSLKDTLNTLKKYHVGSGDKPWRGVGKDDEVFAASLKFKHKADYGTVEIEPYWLYNEASDQKVEFEADTKTELGTLGLSVEHKYKGFEWGGEAAMNYGNEILYHIDRNRSEILRDDLGNLVERYTHIYDNNPAVAMPVANKVLITPANLAAAEQRSVNGQQIGITGLWNAEDRFRPSYKNKLRGWMAVIDGAYTFEDPKISLAAALGYASGDGNPHKKEESKKYHGFVGLHELYTGKRVKSVILLDERLMYTPSSLVAGDDKAKKDASFSDLMYAGVATTWNAKLCENKKLSINPNLLFFWKADTSKKYDATRNRLSTEDASKFFGTEFNVITNVEVLQGLKLYGVVATFLPGQHFTDIKGIPADGVDNGKLGNSTNFHLNVGLEYKF